METDKSGRPSDQNALHCYLMVSQDLSLQRRDTAATIFLIGVARSTIQRRRLSHAAFRRPLQRLGKEPRLAPCYRQLHFSSAAVERCNASLQATKSALFLAAQNLQSHAASGQRAGLHL
ncbi:hypothetical protein G6N82_08980 [Altererythrobacter sp. BO-6]|uniref:hypothetical protein n=1 Tax=Altererythrobacter sp. BO-6 TaxID=2604537 RepID=UPI0013E156AC|nr:hypothetical protein [Altererythrobacter sp. BO-6]QIG52756.1 hypothetical protein G6N82_08980 [Altererythrobacter sp. BO-6]